VKQYAIESRYQHKFYGTETWRPWGEWKEIGYFTDSKAVPEAIAELESAERKDHRAEFRVVVREITAFSG